MLKVWWFPEFLPEEQKIFDDIIDLIKQSYERFWYDHIQTPAVERNKVLLAKWWEEVSKQIFWLYWLAQWCEKDTKDYSLHFDLTVPFARYVLDYESKLTFPFKRYQIQPVWRGERQQKWRFREFWQADIDVIWQDKIENDLSKVNGDVIEGNYIWYDIEVVWVLMYTLDIIFKKFNLKNKFVLRLNNKKIIAGILRYFDKLWFDDEIKNKFVVILDKFHKIWEKNAYDEIKDLILNKWYWNNVANKLIDLLQDNKKLLLEMEIAKIDEYFTWLAQINSVLNWLNKFFKIFGINNRIDVIFDKTIVRWLDYYTWTVFETFISWVESLWSICSWWRYDNLTWYIDNRKNYFNWVWWSIWVNRLFDWILDNVYKRRFYEKYLIVNFDYGEIFEKNIKLMKKLIDQGNTVEIYPFPDKLKKQFRYADRKGFKYVIIMGEEEINKWIYKIRNMETWEEKEVKFSY